MGKYELIKKMVIEEIRKLDAQEKEKAEEARKEKAEERKAEEKERKKEKGKKEENKCEVCNLSFSEKGNLNKHIRSVHEVKKPFK